MRTWWLAVALLVLGAGPARAASTSPLPRLLVLDFRAQGVDDSTAAQATQLAAQAAHDSGRYSVITRDDVRQALGAEQARALLGCEARTECIARAGAAAAADKLLVGTVGRVGEQYTASLALVTPKDGSVEAREILTARGGRELARVLATGIARFLGGGEDVAAPRWNAGGARTVSLAVLDLQPTGVTADTARNLTQVLSTELKRAPGVTVISRDDVEALLQLEADKLKLGCDDASCLAEIGGALGVEKLVAGNVGRLAGSHIITLRLISVRATRVENRVTESFSGPEDQLIRAVRHAGRRLLGLDSAVGALIVTSAHEGAQLTVDGTARGSLPMKPLGNVASGQHTLLLQRSGFRDFASDVYVDPGETTALWIDLVPVPLRWYQRWQVWAGAGAAAALLATVMVGVLVAGGVGAFAVYRLTTATDPPGTGSARLD